MWYDRARQIGRVYPNVERLKMEMPRYTMKEIVLPTKEQYQKQLEDYQKFLEQHFGLSDRQLGYKPKTIIFD